MMESGKISRANGRKPNKILMVSPTYSFFLYSERLP